MTLMRHLILLIPLAILTFASSAAATPPDSPSEANAQTCAQSFPERLQDARDAIERAATEAQEYDKVMPWWNEHCRWLTDLEIAIRKIDDPNAFVCDTKKGRPKGLTSDFVLDHQQRATAQPKQKFFASSFLCEPFDVAERVSIVMRDSYDPARQTTREQKIAVLTLEISVMCFQVETARCAELRAQFPLVKPPAAPVTPPASHASDSRSE